MNNQQGFIELDGEAVSQAAQKAYVEAKAADDIYNAKSKQREAKLLKENEYWRFHAEKDFSVAFEELKYEEIVEVKSPGFFFDRTTTTKRWNVDVDVMVERLLSVSEYWDEFGVREAMRTTTKNYHYDFFCNRANDRQCFYRFDAYSHIYFKQFFDLKGKVLLTLEQYQKLKPYME